MQKFVVGSLIALTLGLAWSQVAPPAKADTSLQAMQQVAAAYAQALSNADAQALQAVCTPQLWARLQPAFAQGAPAAGSLGVYEPGQAAGALAKPGYYVVYLLCRHPDGVEDVVLCTLKEVGGDWKVCGGPTGATPAQPF